MKTLVTGGIGYIGSHCVAALCEAGHDVAIVDHVGDGSEEVSKRDVIGRLRRLTGVALPLFVVDIRDGQAIANVVAEWQPECVIHLAGLKSATQSLRQAAIYRETNVEGTRNILDALCKHDVFNFVFSSSAAVYGTPQYLPVDEDHPLKPLTPYAETKLEAEHLLACWVREDERRSAFALRYFNPGGAHPSGAIGEFSDKFSDNLVPIIARTATGLRDQVTVYGNDYDTVDGTPMRDFIHIMDLAEVHMAAVEKLRGKSGLEIVNVGAGNGATVLQAIQLFSEAAGAPVPYCIAERRIGDISASIASTERARTLLNWSARRTLEDLCRTALFWQKRQNSWAHAQDLEL